ncbi:MAG: patatin-like phospholipase family protein [Deltaproteobacteria bacterium]|nr:MAG: patatin-like phospholipase family protein [Deltaproteobacteria bacterium]
MSHYDTARWAERRRPLDALERKIVRMHVRKPDEDATRILEALRYVISFARLTEVRNKDGQDIDVGGLNHLHAMAIRDTLEPRVNAATSLWEVARVLPDVVERTRAARDAVLGNLPLDRDSLEAEVTTRLLLVASGGGGGAGYVYPGAYEALERNGLVPDLMVGTSIGALMSMFRARRRVFDAAPMISAARSLSWTGVFRMLETDNRYGIPATLRLYLRAALGHLFLDGERPVNLSDMEIPLFIVSAGITVDALKHDLDYYESLLAGDMRKGVRANIRTIMKTAQMLREFLARRDDLVEVVIGRTEGTEDFDVLDAAGFSAAIPGVIHYDVLRDDPRMHRVLDTLYAAHGITRLGEGGLVSNVPARIAWETAIAGQLANGRRNNFVLALDCFAPNARRAGWYAIQQIVRTDNVNADRAFADLYHPFARTLSPVNLVPAVRDTFAAMSWGREELEPSMPFVRAMMRPIEVL